MTLLDLMRLLRRSWKLIGAFVVVGAIGGLLATLLQPTVYSASSTGYLIAATANPTGTNTTYDRQAAQTYAAQRAQQYLPLAETKVVREEMQKILDGEGYGATASAFSVSIVPGSNILQVKADGPTAQQAQARANAGVRAMAGVIHRMETLTTDVAKASEAGNLQDLEAGSQASVALVNLEPATLPASPTSPNLKMNLAIGLAAGLVLGSVVAFARKFIDTRVRTSAEVEQLTGASVLGVIPRTAELGKQRHKEAMQAEAGLAAEALRKLRTNLRFASLDDPARSIVVTSANPGEGKSTVASNLARVLAEAGHSVILVDCDLRKPMQAKAFHLDGRLGITQVLTGDVMLNDALQETGTPGLRVLTAGRIPPNPSEVVGSKALASLLHRLAERAFVIIDAPPLLPVTDAGLLGTVADGVLLVTRVGKTHKDQVQVAVKSLQQVNAKLLGTVINGATKRQYGEIIYGYGKTYGYQSTYYYGDEPGGKRARKHRNAAVDEADSAGIEPYNPSEPTTIVAERTRSDQEPGFLGGGKPKRGV